METICRTGGILALLGSDELVVTSRAFTGKQWRQQLLSKGVNVSPWAKNMLIRNSFPVTPAGEQHKFGIVFGHEIKGTITTEKFCEKGYCRGWQDAEADDAPCLRELISDAVLEQAGLMWIVVKHDPIPNVNKRPDLLGFGRREGGNIIDACLGTMERVWLPNDAMIFRRI